MLADLDLTLPQGSCTALLGPSGCGKTTLLRLIGQLERPSRGAVTRLPGPVGICFQEPRLLPWRSVRDNVALPLELSGVAAPERRQRATAALQRVQLQDFAEHQPHQLSGGMRMRAALARAMVAEPTLLLLDEPFAALDEVTRQDLDLMLRRLWQTQQFTAVLVTHSLSEAAFVAERVLLLSPSPGKLVGDFRTSGESRAPDTWTAAAHNLVVRQLSHALQQAVTATDA